MISVEKALSSIETVACHVKKMEIEVSGKVQGYVLAESVYSKHNFPFFNQSAMDGYAVCLGDSSSFEILDSEIKAGDEGMILLKKGQAVRIFTGAPVPESATAVVMQEKVKVENNVLFVEETLREGQNIRFEGEEIKKGTVLFESGHVITPATVGVLTSLGIHTIAVYQKPKVAVIVTGNELLSLTEELTRGKIYNSNTYTLGAFLEEQQIEAIHYFHVKDDLTETEKVISKALQDHDVVLITGGISVGEYDFVKESLERNGVQEIFYKVKQKPGKPLFFGKVDQTFVFGLPGNPAAALTGAYLYVLPLLNRLKGKTSSIHLPRVKATALNSYQKKGDRAYFLKARFEKDHVEILGGQGSGMMHSFSMSNALVYLSEEKMEIKEGEEVVCIPIRTF